MPTSLHNLRLAARRAGGAPPLRRWRSATAPPPVHRPATDEENVRVLSAHFGKVLKYLKYKDDSVIEEIIAREVSIEFESTPEWVEFIIAVVELTNDKSPGPNNAPPNAFKAMTAETLLHLFDFIVEFWEDRLDSVECHEGQVIPVPKSGELFDPNRWRGVNLMDIGAKVFSSIMCKHLFCIIKKYECTTQFGSSPGVGCPDGRFVIKTALHTRHKHNLPTYVDFF